MQEELRDKPLIEAILEIRWTPSGFNLNAGLVTPWLDPAYPLYLGILYGVIRDRFPVVEELPARDLPDAISPGIVKSRLRASVAGWPIVQVGPGVLTINYTDSYSWKDFSEEAVRIYGEFQEAYKAGSGSNAELTAIMLRYIDAIETPPPSEESLLVFAREKLHVGLELPADIAGTEKASNLDIRFAVEAEPGIASLRLAAGLTNSRPALICETSVTKANHVPQDVKEVHDWLEQSHKITHTWFFAMISGELLEKFRGK